MTTTRRASVPRIIERSPVPYVGVRRSVTMATISDIADALPSLIGALHGAGVEPAGPPFLRYDVFHRSGRLDMEAGVPVAAEAAATAVAAAEHARSGTLVGGRFASVTHVGHPDGLRDATADLLDWGADQGLTWDTFRTADTESWGLRLELYKTDPTVQPDLDAWETELVFRLADHP